MDLDGVLEGSMQIQRSRGTHQGSGAGFLGAPNGIDERLSAAAKDEICCCLALRLTFFGANQLGRLQRVCRAVIRASIR